MNIHGKCHCGNLSFTLDWPGETPEIPARACGCSFCVRHGAAWTSHPGATLVAAVRDAALHSRYEFETRTATFHVCARCGAVPLVTCELDGHLHAVVNVTAFDGVDPRSIRRSAATFEGEDMDSRLARRKRNWISNVRLTGGAHAP